MGFIFFQSTIVLIIVLIIIASENGKLKQEIKKLKNNKIYNYCPKCGHQLNEIKKQVNNQQKAIIEKSTVIVDNNKEIKQAKPKLNESEVKNNIILITGSILIILAAVIYLTSSWSTSSNILKCLLIFIMFLVFIFSSHIAKEKLKLPQTSRAFNYIALAYLPLSLISLSIFGLLGKNFSIYGSYQNLYLSITMFICSIIYYLESKNTKDMFLSIANIISTVIGLIFLTIFVSDSFLVLLMFLYLYSYFLALLYERKRYIYSERFTKNVIKIFFYTLLGILILVNLIDIIDSDLSRIAIIQNICLLLMNIALSVYLKNDKLNKYIIPISIVLASNYFRMFIDTKDYIQQIIVILSIPVIYLYNYLTEKKINIFNFVFSSLLMLTLFFISSLYYSYELIPSYIILLLYVILLLITYTLAIELRKVVLWMLPIFIELTIMSYIILKDLSINILLGVSTLIVLTSLIPKLKDNIKEIIIIPTILNIIYILIAYSNRSLITFILILISLIVYYLLTIKNNNNYKYILYVFINIGMIYLGNIICKGLTSYTMALSVIIIISLEVMEERLKDKGNFTYILIDYFITAYCLTIVDKRTAFIMTIVISLVLGAYLFDNKMKKSLYIIPLLTPLLYVGTSSVMIFNEINIMLIISIIAIVTIPLLLIKNKDYIVLWVVPYAYILTQLLMDNVSVYYPYTLALIVSLVYYILSNKKQLFKIMIILTSLLLYYKIINDLKITLTLFTTGILVIYSLFITRNMMKNTEDKKIIEYILLIIINLMAVSSYTSEVDGMLFVILLLIITIYSYLKKYGPAFIVSIAFILINMFLLTRVFWLSLPWWIYILVVGIVLIIFAILNEISEKDKVKNIITEFKTKLKL